MHHSLMRDIKFMLKNDCVDPVIFEYMLEKQKADLEASHLTLDLQLIMMHAMNIEEVETQEHSKCRNSLAGSPERATKRQRESVSTLMMSPESEEKLTRRLFEEE